MSKIIGMTVDQNGVLIHTSNKNFSMSWSSIKQLYDDIPCQLISLRDQYARYKFACKVVQALEYTVSIDEIHLLGSWTGDMNVLIGGV